MSLPVDVKPSTRATPRTRDWRLIDGVSQQTYN